MQTIQLEPQFPICDPITNISLCGQSDYNHKSPRIIYLYTHALQITCLQTHNFANDSITNASLANNSIASLGIKFGLEKAK